MAVGVKPSNSHSRALCLSVSTAINAVSIFQMVIIQLTKGYETEVDNIDLRFSLLKWHVLTSSNGSSYAARKDKKTRNYIFLHDLIMIPPRGFQVDHIDRNGLNNKRKNLRLVKFGSGINQHNRRKSSNKSSQFKGVHKVCIKNKYNYYVAQINKSGNTHFLGSFKNEIEAAIAYDSAARDLYDEYATTNKSLNLL